MNTIEAMAIIHDDDDVLKVNFDEIVKYITTTRCNIFGLVNGLKWEIVNQIFVWHSMGTYLKLANGVVRSVIYINYKIRLVIS